MWAVALTPPNSETRAASSLTAAGFICYLPTLLYLSYRRGLPIHRQSVLFPGYLFIQFVDYWREVFSLRDVNGLLMNNNQPMCLNDDIIKEIKMSEGSDGHITLNDGTKIRRRFRKGNLVRVKHGPFFGACGIVASLSGKDRVGVLLDMLGRKTSVTLGENELSVA